MDFTMIYLNISLFHWTVGSSKADSLSGSPSIFISWHRAWHMMDQSSRSCYYLLPPTPLVLSLGSAEYTLISISSYLHLSRSMAYFTFLNPGVTFSIFTLIPLSAPIKLPLPSWYKFSHGFWTTTLSVLHLSHWLLLLSLFWWPLCFSLSSKCQSVPGSLFLICTYSVNLTSLNITHMMKTSELYISSLQISQSYSLQQDITSASSRYIRTNFLRERRSILVCFSLSRSGFITLHLRSNMRSLVYNIPGKPETNPELCLPLTSGFWLPPFDPGWTWSSLDMGNRWAETSQWN